MVILTEPENLYQELLTLYKGQAIFWQQYEKMLLMHEKDPYNCQAPTPTSGVYLLIHFLSKLSKPSPSELQQAFKKAKVTLQLARH
jgi:hypothetical protein